MKQKECLKEFARYTTLNVLGMIGLSCYILADTFFVSKGLGTNGLAALNLAIPVYSFIHGSGLMLGVGGATKYSVYRGQGEKEEANKVFSHTVYLAVILAVVFVLIGLFLSDQVTTLLGANTEIFSMTKTYLQVILLFAPAFIMNDVLICFVRNDGNPRLSMIAMLVGSLSNIVLDYVFIFTLRMGIFGAVLATGIAPSIGSLILFRYIKKRANFHLRKVKVQGRLLGNLVSLGVPSLITEVASGVVMIVFNAIILQIQGNVGVAAYGVIANLSLVMVSICTGIAQGMQPLLSKAYGSNDGGGIKQIWRYGVRTTLVISFIIYILVFIFAGPVTGIFNSENNIQLQLIAENGMKLYFLAVPFVGYNVMISMYFISTEKAVPAQIISLLRGLILIVPMAFLLSYMAGLTGVWLALPITEAMVAILGMSQYKHTRLTV